MPFLFFARFADWRHLPSPTTRRSRNAFPCPRQVAHDLAAAHDLDRRTAWPTHRIRCVLQAAREGRQ